MLNLLFFSSFVYASTLDNKLNNIGVESIDIENSDVKNNENINDFVTYKDALESVVSTIFQRDSFFYELNNVEKVISEYQDEIENEKFITRLEFIKLYTEIENRFNYEYNTDTVINICEIFKDLDNYSPESLKSISQVYRYEIFMGSGLNFNADDFLTNEQLEIVIDRIKNIETLMLGNQGYFKNISFFFDLDACNELLSNFKGSGLVEYDSIYSNIKVKDIEKIFLKEENDFYGDKIQILLGNGYKLEDYLDYKGLFIILNSYFKDCLFIEDVESKKFICKIDNSIISEEFVGYVNSKLLTYVPIGEVLYVKRDLDSGLNILDELETLENYEITSDIFELFFKNELKILEDGKECVEYFTKFDTDVFGNNVALSLALHECQHELSAKKSNCFLHRDFIDSDGGGVIWWSHRPNTFYYYDFLRDSWVDLDYLYVPTTYNIYLNLSNDLKDSSSLFKYYGSGSNEISNKYGIYGLLQEFASYALEFDYNYHLYSYGYSHEGNVKNKLKRVLIFDIFIHEYLEDLKEKNNFAYNTLMKDMDFVYFFNQTNEYILKVSQQEEIYNLLDDRIKNWVNENLLEKTIDNK